MCLLSICVIVVITKAEGVRRLLAERLGVWPLGAGDLAQHNYHY